jgi:hypothetical protein
MSDESVTEVKETEESSEKKTNRVFTQSEVDQIAAKQVSKYKEQLSDYETIKAQNESLAEKIKAHEMEKLSKEEKLNAQLAETEQKLARLAAENSSYRQNSRKLEILNTEKYADLPMKVKNAISPSDEDENIIKEADEWLEVLSKNTSTTVSSSFGVPSIETKDTVIAENGSDMAKGLRAQLDAKLKSMGART